VIAPMTRTAGTAKIRLLRQKKAKIRRKDG